MRLLYKTGPMESLRKWFYKPKRDDRSLLAQFFFADDALNMVAAELDSFDGRKDPERCSTLVNQLRHAQDRVLNITSQIMDQLLGDERVARGFRVKFPEDVLQDNLAGQLWFGAECLAAGSSIMNREEESAAMRPLAKALTRSLETVRSLLREQCLRPRGLALAQHDEMLHESLKIFDRLFAEFELCYVSAMVTVKSPQEFEVQQLICVLFSETLSRALKMSLLTQEQVDSYDPALMFAVPRLGIVSGLLIFSSGPLSIDKSPDQMSDMFRPFRTLLHKIRSLLWTLDRRELMALERLLCTNEDISNISNLDAPGERGDESGCQYPDIGEFVSRFYADHALCRDLYTTQQSSTSEPTITDGDYLPDNVEILTPIIDGLRRLSEDTDVLTSESTAQSFGEISTEDIAIHSTIRKNSTDTTDTFQTNDIKELQEKVEHKSRKTSRSENTDLSSLRNLSTNGLLMFDPLLINAVSSSQDSSTRHIPDPDLVMSLNEQVTEIADKLSTIVTHDAMENTLQDNNQIHSYSTSDVPMLIATDCSLDFSTTDTHSFAATRSDQLNNMPSTSHGYLIPNAISQEPVVLASLSHNNSAIFNEGDDTGVNHMNTSMLSSDLPLIIPDNITTDVMNTSISIANANLSSLLLTNDEFRHSFLNGNEDRICDTTEVANSDSASFHSANMIMEKDSQAEKVKFMLGYESDTQEISPGDSGVSTENTSLDRSPDSDQNKEMRDRQLEQHYMKQNRVLMSPTGENINEQVKDGKHSLESSFSECVVNNEDMNKEETEAQMGDVTVNITYLDDSYTQYKNEAGSSAADVDMVRSDIQTVNIENNDKSDNNFKNNCNEEDEYTSLDDVMADLRESRGEERYPKIREVEEYTSLDEVLADNKRRRELEKRINSIAHDHHRNHHSEIVAREEADEYTSLDDVIADLHQKRANEEKRSERNAETSSSSTATATIRQKKPRKSNSKIKKKRTKMWSPGKVILDNRSSQNQNSPLKLDLDHFVDETCSSGTSWSVSECADDEEIALALQAQEFAARQQARSKFRSSEDLIHRLFVCIAGVADQLQTNFAADLRNILKSVFLMNQTPEKPDTPEPEPEPELTPDTPENEKTIEYEVSEEQVIQNGSSFDSVYSAEEVYADSTSDSTDPDNSRLVRRNTVNVVTLSNERRDLTIENEVPTTSVTSDYDEVSSRRKSVDNAIGLQSSVSTGDLTEYRNEGHGRLDTVERPPEWIPDIAAPDCMRCSAHFTAFRRRHHCRNCGKVFCASCSANSIPLPRYGQPKPVRVCEECFRTLAKHCRRNNTYVPVPPHRA